MKIIAQALTLLVIAAVLFSGFLLFKKFVWQKRVLEEVISRLEADSRIAQVLVTDVRFDEKTGKNFTTIKFLEFDWQGKPLSPKYFTFSGNIIQFQSLVIRFQDNFIRQADKLKGKSAYLFLKAFMLDGKNTVEYEITPVNCVPSGYSVSEAVSSFERRLWERFWDYALKHSNSPDVGVKNAQIEAPGSIFIPGMLYTIKIEHDGGMRIDVQVLPQILKGEHIL